MKRLQAIFLTVGAVLLSTLVAGLSYAQGPLDPTFTYQGQLAQGGQPVNAICDFHFNLYDAATAGNRVGIIQTATIAVVNGQDEFGADAFNGDPRRPVVKSSVGTAVHGGRPPTPTPTPRTAPASA